MLYSLYFVTEFFYKVCRKSMEIGQDNWMKLPTEMHDKIFGIVDEMNAKDKREHIKKTNALVHQLIHSLACVRPACCCRMAGITRLPISDSGRISGSLIRPKR